MKKIFFASLIFAACGFLASPAFADTPPPITISPDSGIFNVTNAAPGGIYPSSELTVTNNTANSQVVQFAIDATTTPPALAGMLFLRVVDNQGDCIYDCNYTNSLAELNANKIKISLGDIEKNSSLRYKFYLKFSENANNDYQNTSLTFNILLDYAESDGLVQGTSASSSNDSNHHSSKKKKKKTAPPTVAGTVGNFLHGVVAGAEAAIRPGNADNGQVGAGTAPGEQNGRVKGSETQRCQDWPVWLWLVAFLIFVLGLAADIFKNYKKMQYGWKISLAWVVVAVIFWFIFDTCRDARWFLYLTILFAIVWHFSYLSLLKKKIRASK